jgi:hypothetical protein
MTPTTKINYKFREHLHEVQGQDSLGLRGEELAPAGTGPPRRGIEADVVQDPPHGGGGNAMAEPDQLALHAPMAPGGVLCCHTRHKFLDRRRSRGTSRATACGVVPLARDQPAVPGQDRGGSDRKDLGPAAARQQPGQGGQPHPVGRRVAHPGNLSAQHSVLVP